MTVIIRRPTYRIWVEGSPQSGGKRPKSRLRYTEKIRAAATEHIKRPLNTARIGVEVYFRTEGTLRADVDNAGKAILDALKGVVYVDDKQVRWLLVSTHPIDDVHTLIGPVDRQTLKRLYDGREFLVDIYVGTTVPSPGLQPDAV